MDSFEERLIEKLTRARLHEAREYLDKLLEEVSDDNAKVEVELEKSKERVKYIFTVYKE